jgi:hypothetical protein
MALNFTELDALKAGLEREHPGWRIWYVPGMSRITWCAQPTPTLNEDSPEDLAKAIGETEADWKAEGVRV